MSKILYGYFWARPLYIQMRNFCVCIVYTAVKYDSRGTFLFNTMKNAPELYRKYEAYIILSGHNITVQFHFEGELCSSVTVEVS